MSDPERFFDRYSNYGTTLAEVSGAITLEELYQAFKARMQQEARDEAHPDPSCPARHPRSC